MQWERVKASMHRVDTAGILDRLTGMGCVVRRVYSVRGPRHLQHIDTNHKLIRYITSNLGFVTDQPDITYLNSDNALNFLFRYNIVIFGGIDGFSRKVL